MFSIIFLGQGGKSAVNVDPITCQDKLEDFPSIIEDVMNMANWAYERTLGTYDAELPIPDMRVTLSAVTVYFASPSDEELIFLTGMSLAYKSDFLIGDPLVGSLLNALMSCRGIRGSIEYSQYASCNNLL